jgi:hypothetical protein
MNDYLIHRLRDIPRVAWEGLRLRHRWPETEGALGLWFAVLSGGRRQVSVSAWTAERFDRVLIWKQAYDRLRGCVEGVPHH